MRVKSNESSKVQNDQRIWLVIKVKRQNTQVRANNLINDYNFIVDLPLSRFHKNHQNLIELFHQPEIFKFNLHHVVSFGPIQASKEFSTKAGPLFNFSLKLIDFSVLDTQVNLRCVYFILQVVVSSNQLLSSII